MSAWHLVIKELAHRKGNFLLGLTSMVAAVVCLIGAVTLVRSYDHHARAIIFAKAEALEKGLARDQQRLEAELAEQGAQLEKDLAEVRAAVERDVVQAQQELDAELGRQKQQFQLEIARAEQQLQRELAEQEQLLDKQLAELRDQIRRTMKGLGFNIFIFPEGQDLHEVYSQGYASKTMPEAYATKLANSDIMVVNHLLPSLTQKVPWTEKKRSVILIGIRGEVPIKERTPNAPLLDPVPPGKLVLGYELHNSLGIAQGDEIVFNERTFTVQQCHPERGSIDDITIWMNLTEAQKLLGKPGQINSILALECNCETVDRLAEIRTEIGKILPGTKIIEKKSQALARAEARSEVARRGKELLERKQAEGRRLIEQKTRENRQLLEQKEGQGERLVAQKKADGQVHVARTAKDGRQRLVTKKRENDGLVEQKTRANDRIIAQKQQERQDLGDRRALLATVIGTLVVAAAGAWIAFVMLANVRERRTEVGILRAMGVRGRTILSVFLIKACLMGLAGAAVGCGIGLLTAPRLHERLGRGIAPEHLAAVGRAALLRPWEAAVILLAAPLLAGVAAWLPAAWAARQDPAVILQQE